MLVEELTYAGIVAAARLLVDSPRACKRRRRWHASRCPARRRARVGRADGRHSAVASQSHRRIDERGAAREILEVIRSEQLAVIEDDTYGFLVPESRPLTADLDGVWCYVTGLSKSLAAGFRTGFLATAPAVIDRAKAAMFATASRRRRSPRSSPVSLIADGTADRIVAWKCEETRARMRLARKRLPDCPMSLIDASPPHLAAAGAAVACRGVRRRRAIAWNRPRAHRELSGQTRRGAAGGPRVARATADAGTARRGARNARRDSIEPRHCHRRRFEGELVVRLRSRGCEWRASRRAS